MKRKITGPPCSQPRAKASEENAALGSLQASPQVPGQSTGVADLSKNRLTEVPVEVCHFVSLEILNLYHNCVKVIPDAIVSLHMLTYLNLSRNQLSTLPACLCGLPLKVLIASNNKLGALPEEIGHLKQLMELDISCNEVTALPQQIGQLKALRELNVRKNYLSVLPEDLVSLPLVKLDFSCNKVEVIPVCYRKMSHLQTLQLDNNPLQSPPAQGRAAEFDEPLRIEEDTSWATEPMTNPPNNQEIHIEMINQLREAVELLQDPDRLNMNTEDSTRVQLYHVHTVTTENLNSSVNGQTYQDVSMTRTRESIGGELEFQKKRELILGKARVEAQLACQRFERQMSNQCVCIINPLTSGTAHWSLLKPLYRNLDMVKTVLEIRGTTVRWPLIVCFWTDNYITEGPLTQALAGDNTSFTTPTEGGMTNSVFLRTPRKLESMDPQFTIRRKMEQMREELDLMDQLREPKLSMAKCRRNVENFLDACRKMGVPEVIHGHVIKSNCILVTLHCFSTRMNN
ncbi:UNVERIFIED_CONTAM: hypothetical protein FKN15_029786 [Acipenser sinensis]